MLAHLLSSFIILYSTIPLILTCSWISRTGVYRVSVSDVAYADGFSMIYIPSGSATLFGSIYDGSGNIVSNTVIKTLPNPGQGTIQVQGLIDGTFAICIQDMISFPYYEIRSSTFSLITGPTTLVSDLNYQCMDIATFGANRIVFMLKTPVNNYHAYTYYVNNIFISSITTFWPPFEVLRPTRTGFCSTLSSYTAQCTVSPNDMNSRVSSGWTLPGDTEFNFHVYYPASSTVYELLIYGTGGLIKVFLYTDRSTTATYEFNMIGSIPTYFSSAVSPATGNCLFCWYSSPSVNCYLFNAISRTTYYGSVTLTQPEPLTNISVTSLSSGKFLVSLWASSNFYFTFFGSTGACSFISTDTGCAGECVTCLNLNQLRFCGFSTVTTCSAGFYPNSNNCLACPTNCSTCTNGTYCLSCNNSNYLTPSNTCSATCPSGFFANTTSAQCVACPIGCATCNSLTNCLTCSPLYYTYLTNCVNVCPAGFFLFNNVCNTTCPSGFYGNSTSRTCMACPANCSTSCFNTSACISCTSGYFLLGTTCHNNTCPTTFRPVTGQCQACISGCDSCSDAISCDLCSVSFFWNNASCLGTCPSYAFPNITSRSCMNCTNNCSSCISYTNCSSCNPGYYLLNNTCLSTCPLGYYANTTTKTCSLCLANCYNCSTSTSCDLCNLGFYWNNVTCNQTCPAGYLFNPGNRMCESCRSGCSQCVLVGSCNVCQNPFTTTDQTCPCPAGTRLNTSLICQSISSLNITVNFTSNNTAIRLDAAVLDEELVAFPTRLYSWIVATNNTNISMNNALNSYLSVQSSRTIYVAYSYFDPSSMYSFTCSYVNILNLTISNAFSLGVLSFLIPSITLDSNLTGHKRFQPIIISASIASNIYSNLNSHYVISTGSSFPITATQNVLTIQGSISACTLLRNSVNNFTISSYFSMNNLFASSKSYSIPIGPDSFTVTVNSLDRTQPYNFDISLTGNIIFDGSCPDYTATTALYSWNCTKSTNMGTSYSPCTDPSGLFGVQRSSNTLTIPKSYYTIDNILNITLIVGNNGFTGSKSGLITIQGDKTLILSITCQSTPCTKYNSNTDLNLKTSILNDPGVGLKMTWNLSIPVSFIAFNDKFYMNADTTAYSGATIKFTVTVSDPVFSGTGTFLLPVNSPPVNGSLVANPTTGETLSTLFNVTAANWTDSDLPLTFQFFYLSLGEKILLTQQTRTPHASTILSGKAPSEDITLVGFIYDSFNAPIVAYVNVTVNTPSVPVGQALDNLFNVANTMTSSDPYQSTAQNAVIISQLTNVEDSFAELRKNITSCTGCPNGENICQFGTCLCRNSTGGLVDCSLSQAESDKINDFKINVVNNLAATFNTLQSNGTDTPEIAKAKESIMNNIKMMTNNPEMMSPKVMNSVVDFMNNAMGLNDPNKTMTVGQASQASKIVSNLMGFSANSDCNCTTSQCKGLQNTTTAVLEKTSQSALKNQIPGQSPYVISTPSFDLAATSISICDIGKINLASSSQSPTVSFEAPSGTLDCTQTVQIQAYSFPSNMFDCSIISTKDVVMVNIVNTATGEVLNDKVKVKLIMPEGVPCPSECPKRENQCSCPPDALDIRGQMNKIFKASNLKDLKNFSALNNWDWYHSPIFWVNAGAAAWLLINVFLFNCFKSFNNFCLVLITKNNMRISNVRGIITMYLILSEFTGVYFLNTDVLSKSVRTMLFYLKIVFYSTYSAIFAGVSDTDNILDLILSLNLVTLLLPYCTVLPIAKVVKFIVISQARSSNKKGCWACIKKIFSTVITLSITGGCIFAMFVIAANKSQAAQIPWLATFITMVTQEAFLNPMLLLVFQWILAKIKKKTQAKYGKSIARAILLRPLDPEVDIIYGKMISGKELAKVRSETTLNFLKRSASSLGSKTMDNQEDNQIKPSMSIRQLNRANSLRKKSSKIMPFQPSIMSIEELNLDLTTSPSKMLNNDTARSYRRNQTLTSNNYNASPSRLEFNSPMTNNYDPQQMPSRNLQKQNTRRYDRYTDDNYSPQRDNRYQEDLQMDKNLGNDYQQRSRQYRESDYVTNNQFFNGTSDGQFEITDDNMTRRFNDTNDTAMTLRRSETNSTRNLNQSPPMIKRSMTRYY